MAVDSVLFSLLGDGTELVNVDGRWMAIVAAPNDSSYQQPDHAYTATITATDEGGNTDTVTEKISVYDETPPEISILEPVEVWYDQEIESLVARAVFTASDAAGIQSVSATLDGESVEVGGEYPAWVIESPTTSGTHIFSVTATDNDGNTGTQSKAFTAMELVINRTIFDVARVQRIAGDIQSGIATQSEIAEYLSGAMKGAYNTSDLNRVGAAYAHLYRLVEELGYEVVGYTALRTDWQIEEVPDLEQMTTYLNTVKSFRAFCGIAVELPDSMEHLDYESANQIERLVYIVQNIERLMKKGFIYSGEVFCGEA